MTPTLAPTRQILAEGCYNVRDLGGYPTQDGQTTRWGRVLRADSLHRLTDSGQAALTTVGIHTIVDLRSASELSVAPNVYASHPTVVYRHAPIFSEASRPAGDILPPASLAEMYIMILDHLQPRLYEVMRVLATPNAAPVLIHCTAGKDRTGLVTALLLSLAGVADAVIAEDYALTGECIQPILDTLRAEARAAGRYSERFEAMLECRPETMLASLTYLRTRYGGAAAYLTTIGLNPAEVSALRALLV